MNPSANTSANTLFLHARKSAGNLLPCIFQLSQGEKVDQGTAARAVRVPLVESRFYASRYSVAFPFYKHLCRF